MAKVRPLSISDYKYLEIPSKLLAGSETLEILLFVEERQLCFKSGLFKRHLLRAQIE